MYEVGRRQKSDIQQTSRKETIGHQSSNKQTSSDQTSGCSFKAIIEAMVQVSILLNTTASNAVKLTRFAVNLESGNNSSAKFSSG